MCDFIRFICIHRVHLKQGSRKRTKFIMLSNKTTETDKSR